MKLSRREALRFGSGLVAAGGLAGCIEQRVTRRESRVENSTMWTLTPAADAALDRDAFQSYVDDRAERYGDSGVWGLDAEPADTFETAYVQRLVVARQTPGRAGGGEASLDPDDVDLAAPLLVADAAVAVYEVGDGRYRYWLWAAADGDDDRLVRPVDVSVLSARVSFRDGALSDASQVSRSGDEASVGLEGPPGGRFPLNGETSALESLGDRGEGGRYLVDWNGSAGGVQSINGVCEEERDGEHDFFWNVAAGYTYAEQV